MATVVLLLAGKAFITLAYNIAYLYGSEIFPTEVRSVGIGVAAVMEDVGAFVAPLVAGPLVGTRLDYNNLMITKFSNVTA